MRFLFAAPVTFNRITSFISSYITGLAQSAKDLGHEVKVLQTTDTEFNQRTLDLLNRYNGKALQTPEIQKSQIFKNLRKHLAFFIEYSKTATMFFFMTKHTLNTTKKNLISQTHTCYHLDVMLPIMIQSALTMNLLKTTRLISVFQGCLVKGERLS